MRWRGRREFAFTAYSTTSVNSIGEAYCLGDSYAIVGQDAGAVTLEHRHGSRGNRAGMGSLQ